MVAEIDRAVNTQGSKTNTQEPMADHVEDYLEDAERKWVLAKRALGWIWNCRPILLKRKEKRISAENLEDMSNLAMTKYSKSSLRQWRGNDGDIIPVDNVMHSMWSDIDITVNGELVSTTNKKYMYKSYFESILNNSSSTKNIR